MVHHSDDDEAGAGASAKAKVGVRPKAKRKAKTTGLNDADQIQVVSSEEVQENQENVKPTAAAAKVAAGETKKSKKVVENASPKNAFLINEELSVGDVDFFQRHCIETRDLMDVESNIPKSDPSTPSKQQVH